GGEYVQLWEALGQRPERKQFRLTGYAEMCLDHDPDRAFALYAAAVDRALANPTVAAAAAPGSRPQLATTESAGNPPGDDPQAAAPVTERKGLFARLLGGG
ncbi:MAG TPA: hypothetical protein VMT10_14155, partial [Solirubrobacteraceae bacterium]|nr:hypothetical protein [Solirubrobacteraceae bacterium]